MLGQPPDRPVYSNLDAAPHPADPSAIAERLGDHLASPVRFADMIEAMYRDGARVFVEVGPGSILDSDGRVDLERPAPSRRRLRSPRDRPAWPACSARLARLVVAGLPLRLEPLTAGRSQRQLDLESASRRTLASPSRPRPGWSTAAALAPRRTRAPPARPGAAGSCPVSSCEPEAPTALTRPERSPAQLGPASPCVRQIPTTRRIGNGRPDPTPISNETDSEFTSP